VGVALACGNAGLGGRHRTRWTVPVALRIRRLGVRVPPRLDTSERASPEATSEPGRALSLTRLLTAASDGGRYRVSEDVGGLGELVADGVGICAQNLLAQGLPPIRLITSS
jgi:hypothetical protein